MKCKIRTTILFENKEVKYFTKSDPIISRERAKCSIKPIPLNCVVTGEIKIVENRKAKMHLTGEFNFML